MKLVRESLSEGILLSTLTWDKIKPKKDRRVKRRWQPDYVHVPHDFMSSRDLYNEPQFKDWYEEFTNRYGNEGSLIQTSIMRSPITYNLIGNDKWDKYLKASERISAQIGREYDESARTGRYMGD